LKPSPESNSNLTKVRVTLTLPSPLPQVFRIQRVMLYHSTAPYDPWHLHVLDGKMYGPLTWKSIAAPANPIADHASIYQDDGNLALCAKFDNGRVARLASYAGVVTKTAAYGITAGDEVILCNGSFTVTLPSAVGLAGRQFTIKRINASGNVTVATTSSQQIDGASTRVLTAQYEAVIVVSDGANWWVV